MVFAEVDVVQSVLLLSKELHSIHSILKWRVSQPSELNRNASKKFGMLLLAFPADA
jgi:hypothetical protein